MPLAVTKSLRRLASGPPAAAVLLGLCCWWTAQVGWGQPRPGETDADPIETPTPETQAKIENLIAETLDPEAMMELDPRRSKVIRTRRPVTRYSVTNPEVMEVVQYSPTLFELIGGDSGETSFSLYFGVEGEPSEQILRYLVRVGRDTGVEDRLARDYGRLQVMVNELFPNSRIQLIPVADKLIVRGQTRDSEEAAQILSVIRGETVNQTGALLGPGSAGRAVSQGQAAQPVPGESDVPSSSIISLLDTPGEAQVLLKVRVAELSRSSLRAIGADLEVDTGDFMWTSMLGVAGAFSAVLDTEEVQLALSAVSSNGYSKVLAEPNLVTLSGQSASFIAGGEFAVPTVVGIDGVGAATTSFRGFGTQVTFTPTVIDKDRFRLSVVPSFTTINSDLTVNGIPGLNSRSVTTTVDLREGQWLAIAGLIQDEQTGSKVRVPILGDIPILDTIFSRKNSSRDETELLILVSPELVHPMEPEEVPLVLPGMEVTEPEDWDFFFMGYYEGRPSRDHRSTYWPIYRNRIREAQRRALKQAKQYARYQNSEAHYVRGPHGFSE